MQLVIMYRLYFFITFNHAGMQCYGDSWMKSNVVEYEHMNSTQLTTPKEEWINKRKEAKKLIYIPDS